jgi:hypothetical protein
VTWVGKAPPAVVGRKAVAALRPRVRRAKLRSIEDVEDLRPELEPQSSLIGMFLISE